MAEAQNSVCSLYWDLCSAFYYKSLDYVCCGLDQPLERSLVLRLLSLGHQNDYTVNVLHIGVLRIFELIKILSRYLLKVLKILKIKNVESNEL